MKRSNSGIIPFFFPIFLPLMSPVTLALTTVAFFLMCLCCSLAAKYQTIRWTDTPSPTLQCGRKTAHGVMWVVDWYYVPLHGGMRVHLGCGLTGEHPGCADVQVKWPGTDEGSLHMLVEVHCGSHLGRSVVRSKCGSVFAGPSSEHSHRKEASGKLHLGGSHLVSQ